MAKNKKKIKPKSFHRRVIITIGVAATILSMFITSTKFFNQLEYRSIDWRFKMRGPVEQSAPVVIVGIDDASFARMPERWTWPRTFYARVVKNLNKWGAKAVGFDVIYSEATSKNPEEDKAFAAALGGAGNVVMGMAIMQQKTSAGELGRRFYPIKPLKKNAYSLGVIQHPYDKDAYVRRNQPVIKDGDKLFFSMGLEMLGLYYGLDKSEARINDDRLGWGPIDIPFDSRGTININYAGPAGSFRTVPFYKVYYGENIDKSIFRDKMVLIGSVAEILHDVFSTPFSSLAEKMPGVEIHANVINTIYNESYIKRMTKPMGVLLLLAIGLLTSFIMFGIRAWHGLIVLAGGITAFIITALYMFVRQNYLIDFVNPLFAMVFCYLSMSTYKVAVEEKEKRKIRNVFSKYVSKNIVDELLKTEGLKLGGEKREITILFSDIRGFTSMSEKMRPEEVVGLLNEYLTAMTDIIFEHKGTLDKFIGDAVMALYGTPRHYRDHALRAVKAAAAMQSKLGELNKKWEGEGKPPLKIGVGINSGEVIAGNMGSLKRMEYTVIGDSVNLASRLESLNKELGTEILVSESTYEKVKGKVKAEKHTDVRVKGKQEILNVYEIKEILR